VCILTDRGTEFCGQREHHEYQLYLAIENIDHTKTKARSPQTNGICERFHRTMQDEFYSVAFRKNLYTTLTQLQADVDTWLTEYNENRSHSGKYCFGKTPMETFQSAKHLADEKQLDRLMIPLQKLFPRAWRMRQGLERFVRSSLSYYS
jgi:oligoribonuclease NrnB/cAMP/cGMP phosphodiesterase (DHH superfamily)